MTALIHRLSKVQSYLGSPALPVTEVRLRPGPTLKSRQIAGPSRRTGGPEHREMEGFSWGELEQGSLCRWENEYESAGERYLSPFLKAIWALPHF